MKKTVFWSFIATLIAITPFFTSWAAESAGSEKELIMGVFPLNNIMETHTMFAPMTRHLSQALGRNVKLATGKDFPTFWRGVEEGSYDLVYFNQYDYIKSHKSVGYDVILKTEKYGSAVGAGAIAVRNDIGIKTIADLKGKKIIFGGGPTAMLASIVAKHLLLQAGLKPTDYTSVYTTNPPNAVIAMYSGEADAAGTGDKMTQMAIIAKSIDTSKVTLLAVSEQLAGLPWAVKKDMPAALRATLQSTLIMMKSDPEGIAALKSAEITGLLEAQDGDYDLHRKFVKEVLGENY